MGAPRLLLLLTSRTYRAAAFLDAAERLGLAVSLGSDQRPALAHADPAGFLELNFLAPIQSAEAAVAFHRRYPIDAVIAAEDEEVLAAAEIASALGLAHNPPPAVAAARDKRITRQVLRDAGLLCPPFLEVAIDGDGAAAAQRVAYPCVLKPTSLSASRGVIRADNPEQFVDAFDRIGRMLRPPTPRAGDPGMASILVEGYVPGVEVALEGLLTRGDLQRLAFFDKPEPLEGPFFEESIYVTPSRHPHFTQEAAWSCAAGAAAALGLRHGPIHAEVRLNSQGAWLLEIAPRSIGGWCSRSLRFGDSISLEELILRHALGEEVRSIERERAASGVLMLPIPRAGYLRQIGGLAAARSVPGIEEVRIAIPIGEWVEPLPEGDRYLGFAFARAAEPAQVEGALREARSRLEIDIGDHKSQ